MDWCSVISDSHCIIFCSLNENKTGNNVITSYLTYFRMISEGSNDTDNWSIHAENSALNHGNK